MSTRIIAAAVVLAALAGPPALAGEKTARRTESFQYYDSRIQLQIPPGWKVEPRRDLFSAIRLSPTGNGRGHMSIAYHQPLHDRGFQDFKAWTRYRLKGSGATKVRFRTIDGHRAVTWTGTQEADWKLVETDIGVEAPNGGEVFVVFLEGYNEKTSPSTLADYEAVVASVKITPSPAPAP
jgi:hypothetical protein